MSKNKIYKAAVIGCGNIGTNAEAYQKNIKPGTHAGSYEKNARIRLVALVDIDQNKLKRAQKDFPNTAVYTDIQKMMKKERPDIVSIATPTKYHYENVLTVAHLKPKVILCEKPISHSISEAKKMILVCKKNKVTLFINHQRHFDSLLRKWSKKINRGILGQIYQGNAYYYNGLFNAATHLIDLILMFLGQPRTVTGKYNNETSNLPNDKNIDGLIFFKNDLKISLHSLSKNYGYFGLRLYGEKGMLNLTNLCFKIEHAPKIPNPYFKGYFGLSENVKSVGKPRSLIYETIKYIILFLDHQASPMGTGENALIVLKILLALQKSAKQNGKEIKI